MRKYLYLIKKKKIKSWLKFWLLTKDKVNYILSEILEGFSFNLQNTVKRYFKIFNIFGNSVQNGTPTPENPVPIYSVADDVSLFDVSNYTITYGGAIGFDISNLEIGKQYTFSSNLPITDFKISNYSSGYNSVNNYVYNGFTNFTFTMARNSNIPSSETQHLFIALNVANFITDINDITNYNIKIQKGSTPTSYSPYNYGTFTTDFEGQTENYNYTFITKPLRSLPNGVRDSLEDDGIHRKIGIQTGTLSQTTTITLSDAKQNGAYMCNIKSAGTLTGQTIELEAGDYEIIYELATETIEPYTEEQQEEYNKIKELYTFNGTTNIYSDDEVPPYLQIQYYMKGE